MTSNSEIHAAGVISLDDADAQVAGFHTLDEDACWELAASAELGRMAIRGYDEVDIFPVNFLVTGRKIYFRSGPGSKLMDLTRWPLVAFECDGMRDAVRWSVVVRGIASPMGLEHEIIESGVLDLATWAPGEKFNYVCLDPRSISGRQFRLTAH